MNSFAENTLSYSWNDKEHSGSHGGEVAFLVPSVIGRQDYKDEVQNVLSLSTSPTTAGQISFLLETIMPRKKVEVILFRNDGSGNFPMAENLEIDNVRAFAVAALDGDGSPDIVFARKT